MRRKLKIENQKSKIANRFAGFTPLEIPPLEAQEKQSLIRQVRTLDKKGRFLTGFTLTEVVVASGLLIIAIVPMLRALTSSHLNTVTIQHKTHSLTLAQARLDKIRAQSIYHYSDSFTETNSSLDGSYLCNVQDSGPGTDLRTITVSVGYDLDGNSILQPGEIEVVLATFVAKRWG